MNRAKSYVNQKISRSQKSIIIKQLLIISFDNKRDTMQPLRWLTSQGIQESKKSYWLLYVSSIITIKISIFQRKISNLKKKQKTV